MPELQAAVLQGSVGAGVMCVNQEGRRGGSVLAHPEGLSGDRPGLQGRRLPKDSILMHILDCRVD